MKPYAYAPSIVTAMKMFRRRLGIANGCEMKSAETVPLDAICGYGEGDNDGGEVDWGPGGREGCGGGRTWLRTSMK